MSIGYDDWSLRDYFAGQALSGLITQCDPPGVVGKSREDFADWAYEMADAMIAARKEKPA